MSDVVVEGRGERGQCNASSMQMGGALSLLQLGFKHFTVIAMQLKHENHVNCLAWRLSGN